MALNFAQRRDDHAIGQFDASIFLFQSASANAFSRAVIELERYAKEHDIPAPVSRQVIQFDLANQAAVQSNGPQSAGWQRFATNGELETIVLIDDNAAHFTCRNYTTWAEMLPKIVDFFMRVTSPLLGDVPAVTKFQLSYQNQFRHSGPAPASPAEIFRSGSGWIAPNAFAFRDAWHSNSGAFEDISGHHRRLINVNCSAKHQAEIGVTNPVTYVDANLVVAECYDVPNEPPLVVPPNLLSQILYENFDRAHTREKQVLRELISDDYITLMKASDG